jgi:hypothetical protein
MAFASVALRYLGQFGFYNRRFRSRIRHAIPVSY